MNTLPGAKVERKPCKWFMTSFAGMVFPGWMRSALPSQAKGIGHMQELDEKISAASVDWTLDRMPMVDLTILRLAAYEILYEDDVPGSVAINEAVELANRYSEPTSGRFINGVLGTILRNKEAAE